MEGRVAIGLVLLAGVIALPVAVFAWVFGFVSLGAAFLIYVLTGWAVVAAGILSALFAHVLGGATVKAQADVHAVPMKVKPANRG